MRTYLETGRLALRPFRADDAHRLLDLYNDPAVMRYINGGEPTTLDAVVGEVLPRLIHRYTCTGEPGFWAAEERATGAFLGWFEFRPLQEGSPEAVELGYRLRRAAWGAGYATEGARALIRKGFTELGVRRVTAQAMTVNTASRRVMEKAGLVHSVTFHESGHHPIEGSEHGDVEYALTRDAWERGPERGE